MWILYHQFSAANIPTRICQVTNQIIRIDDMEGVDSPMAELMEGGDFLSFSLQLETIF